MPIGSNNNKTQSITSGSLAKSRRQQQRRSMHFVDPISALTTMPLIGSQQRHIKRTRAKQSCDSCRRRKTRCNADEVFPCNTCTTLGVECHLSEQKRRGPVPSTYVEALETRVKRLEEMLAVSNGSSSSDPAMAAAATPTIRSSLVPNNSSTRTSSASPSPGWMSSSVNIPDDDDDDDDSEDDNYHHPANATTQDLLADDMKQLNVSDYSTTLYIGCSAGYHMLDQQEFGKTGRHLGNNQGSGVIVQKVNDEDDEHVIIKTEEVPSPEMALYNSHSPVCHKQRAFQIFANIPYMTPELGDAMLEVYFRCVHVPAPVLNKIAFLEQYYFQNPHPPDPYLLFTVCAIACQFMIKDKALAAKHKITPETFKFLHQCFRQKAEKLLETVFRRSKITTVQALILLASFVNTSQDRDDDRLQWFICGTAIRMAQDLGLHRSSSRWRLPEHESELRKRIWYCAAILDREISAELGRPITIMEDDHDVELPSPYEIESSYGRHTRQYGVNADTPPLLKAAEDDLRERRPVYECFSRYLPLSRVLGHILTELYAFRSPDNHKLEEAKKLTEELESWANGMPSELRADPGGRYMGPAKDEFLNVYYYCQYVLIYRTFIMYQPEISNIELALHALSICTTAATAIIDNVEHMEEMGSTGMPWNFMSYAIFQAATVFLFNAKGENEFLRQQGAKNLTRCADIYAKDDELRESRPAKLLMSLSARFSVAVDHSNINHVDFMTQPTSVDSSNSTTSTSATAHVDNSDPMFTTPNDRSNDLRGNNTSTAPNTLVFTNVSMPTPQQQQSYGPPPPDLPDVPFSNTTNNAANQPQNANLMMGPPSLPSTAIVNNNTSTPTTAAAAAAEAQAALVAAAATITMDMSQQNGMNYLPAAAPMSDVQFDLASLSSELALWEFPTAVTWNEWNPYLHGAHHQG